MAEFLMPILGADMTAGTLIAWRKRPGERVSRGDVIAEVETEKGLIDVEAFVTGVIERILVAPGATVPTGTVLALIREDVTATERPTPAASPPPLAPAAPIAASQPPTPAAPGERVRVSPAARQAAARLGVDIAGLRGTGVDGAVTLRMSSARPRRQRPPRVYPSISSECDKPSRPR